MKVTSGHVIGFLVVVGLAIYFFTKTKVSGIVTADESGAIVTHSNNQPGPENEPREGSVSYGTELTGS